MTSLSVAYICWIPPFGLLGLHHLYLGRVRWFLAYALTLGFLGLGWISDAFLLPKTVDRIRSGGVIDAEQEFFANSRAHLHRVSSSSSSSASPSSSSSIPYENPPFHSIRHLDDAYRLWLPLGLIGVHYLYLRRPGWFALYFLTFGLCGVGWIIDGFLLPEMVTHANGRGTPTHPGDKSMSSTLRLWFPLGIFGLHHYYLGRIRYGILYSLTLGLFGYGWISDLPRLHILVKRANTRAPYRPAYDLNDAFQLVFPFGFLGLHHFYLKRYAWGIAYFFTLGFLFIGPIYDLYRMNTLVENANLLAEAEQDITTDTGTPTHTSGHPHNTSEDTNTSASTTYDSIGAQVDIYASYSRPPRQPLCVACVESPINSVFLDCGHSSFCLHCCEKFVAKTSAVSPTGFAYCPICRQPVRQIKQIFVTIT